MVVEDFEQTIALPTGCRVKVDETRALVELPIVVSSGGGDRSGDAICGWNAISSAIWNGGFRSFRCDNNEKSNNNSNSNSKVCVFNYKVPTTYDGLNPEPRTLLRTAIGNERCDDNDTNDDNTNDCNDYDDEKTVGIMTAASMRSLRTASRSAGGVVVDAIVTAGVSNSRTAGADADVFYMLPPATAQDDSNGESGDNSGRDETLSSASDQESKTAPSDQNNNKNLRHRRRGEKEPLPPPGTINTVIVISAPLSQGAMTEAYAIAIEAKCAACADMSLACAKSIYGSELAQGTGTDCAVLVCPSTNPGNDTAVLEYAGKHCLLAELIGQAVREATREAILTNIYHVHGSVWRYNLHRWLHSIKNLVLRGARPCVPPKPMDPVPPAPMSIILLGWTLVLVSYFVGPLFFLPRSATVLIAATFWDR